MITQKGVSKLLSGAPEVILIVQDFTKVGNQKVAARFKLRDDIGDVVSAVVSTSSWQKMTQTYETDTPLKNGIPARIEKEDVSAHPTHDSISVFNKRARRQQSLDIH